MKCTSCDAAMNEEMEGTCHNCGVINETISFVSHPGTSTTSQLVKLPVKKKGKCYEMGLKKLEILFPNFKANAFVKSRTLALFDQFVSQNIYRLVKNNLVLAGCALYIVLKEESQPISIPEFCTELNCTTKAFRSALRRIKIQGFEVSETAIEELVPSILSKMPSEGKQQLISKVKKLIRLCDSVWLNTGRSPRSLIIACSYLCWRSFEVSDRNVAFKTFCELYDLHNSQAKCRISEIIAMLLKLSQHLGYSPGAINKKNIYTFLDDIIKYSKVLRKEILPTNLPVDLVDETEYKAFRRNIPKKRKSSEITNDADTALNTDISDSEINEYILSDAEVTRKKIFRNLPVLDKNETEK